MGAPRLTTGDEARLAELIRAGRREAERDGQQGVSSARSRRVIAAGKLAEEKYIVGNLRLVYSVANKFQRLANMELDDLIQEGTLGLMHALRKFDWDRGVKFSTYAIPWIRSYIGRAIANQSRLIRLPVNVDEDVMRLARTRERLDLKLGRTAEIEEVAAAMKTTVEYVRQLDMYNDPPLSLSQPENDGLDVAADEQDDSAYELSPETEELLRTCTAKELAAVEMKFGLGDQPQMTENEVATVLAISPTGVRRRQAKAMQKMRLAAAA